MKAFLGRIKYPQLLFVLGNVAFCALIASAVVLQSGVSSLSGMNASRIGAESCHVLKGSSHRKPTYRLLHRTPMPSSKVASSSAARLKTSSAPIYGPIICPSQG